ncbi:UNVERIFIED_ORG: hypothetical protein BDU10_9816 [Burkholderia sp. CF145]|jgi:hypothetical protein
MTHVDHAAKRYRNFRKDVEEPCGGANEVLA